MKKSANTRADRRAAIIAAAQRLSVNCGYSGFTFDDLAEAVGVSRRTLFNHVSSKEEAVLGALPHLTDEQAETLRSGGPTGHLFNDLLSTALECVRSDGDDDFEDLQRLHDIIARNPELILRVKAHVEALTEQIIAEVTVREDVDTAQARMALSLVGGLLERSVTDCIDDPAKGPLPERIQLNLTITRELLAT